MCRALCRLWGLEPEQHTCTRPAGALPTPGWQEPYKEQLVYSLSVHFSHFLIEEQNSTFLLNQTQSHSVGSDDSQHENFHWGPT